MFLEGGIRAPPRVLMVYMVWVVWSPNPLEAERHGLYKHRPKHEGMVV